MTDDKLLGMSEKQIRDRYRDAPAYYLQAKLEKRRALHGHEPSTHKGEPPARIQPLPRAAKISRTSAAGTPQPKRERPRVDAALPGFEILDAALSQLDDPPPSPQAKADGDRTQQEILEATLEDYSNWPLIDDGPAVQREAEPRPAAAPRSDLERRLADLLASEPELELVLESDLAAPALSPVPDNVTVGAFGAAGDDNVHVVSVVLDRKRPYMVRVIGKTTRCAG